MFSGKEGLDLKQIQNDTPEKHGGPGCENVEEETWRWASTGVDGSATLFGVNIFDYPWERIGPPGTRVSVRDADGRKRKMPIYRVTIDGRLHEFAAGEVSNCVYNFYLAAD